MAQNAFRSTPEEHTLYASATVRTLDDQVEAPVSRAPDDRIELTAVSVVSDIRR